MSVLNNFFDRLDHLQAQQAAMLKTINHVLKDEEAVIKRGEHKGMIAKIQEVYLNPWGEKSVKVSFDEATIDINWKDCELVTK